MPIEPPDPLQILAALRTAQSDLQTLAAREPADSLIAAASRNVQAAIDKLAARTATTK